jgi:O-antigen polymerase
MKKILNLNILLPCFVMAIILVLPFVADDSLKNDIQTTKSLFFAFCLLLLMMFRVSVFIADRSSPSRIKVTDILIGVFLMYAFLHALVLGYCITTTTIIETACLILLYLEIRQTSPKIFPILMLSLLLAGTIQAIYGNLQLYGLYPSNHELFKLTGSFFNPGPYAGYLVSILPLALAFYITFNKKNDRNNIRRFLKLPVLKTGSNGKLQLGTKQFLVKPELIVRNLLHFIGIAALITILLVLPATRSRASWLAGLAIYPIIASFSITKMGINDSHFPDIPGIAVFYLPIQKRFSGWTAVNMAGSW